MAAAETPSPQQQLIALNQQLLDSIAAGDWETYTKLCDPTLSAFEPEARGHLIEGMPFHKFYFDLELHRGPVNTTISSPHVRLLGDVAIMSYVRLIQKLSAAGSPETIRFEETRVWQLQDGQWRHVHFHRSAND